MSVVLVTGATGMVGRTIVVELLKRGRKVRAMKRDEHSLDDFKASLDYNTCSADCFFNEIEWIKADINSKSSIAKALTDVNEVYHCAAMVSYDPKKDCLIKKVNIDGTALLLQCCKNKGIERLLYISSANIFKARSNELINETSDFADISESTVYAFSKYYAGELVKASGLKTIIMYPGMIIGNGKKKKDDSSMLQILARSSYTFQGGTGCVDVRDLATIAVLLMEKELFGSEFIVVAENRSFQELSDMIKHDLGKRKAFVLSERILKLEKF